MKLILCLDERNGYSVFNKRQSSDIEVLKRIKDIVGNSKVHMNDYSAELFAENNIFIPNINITETPEKEAGKRDFIFIENIDIDTVPDSIIVFYWNRHYPSDKKYVVDASTFKTKKESKFAGKSHPEITEKHYVQRNIIRRLF